MDDLSKQQIVLLTLLVSFVTSIATGITTVSLLDQAPKTVTQTINRVVEKTIETVTTVPPSPVTQIASPPKPVTVVVKEEDLITEAVIKGERSVVRIKNKKTNALLGMGLIVRNDGIIAADASIVGRLKSFTAIYNGQIFDIETVGGHAETGVVFFKIASTTPIDAAIFSDNSKLKSGQSVITISGAERNTVSIGIISSLIKGSGSEEGPVLAVDTTISPETLLSGTPLFNLDGEFIAMKVGKDSALNDLLTTSGIIREKFAELGI